MDNKKTVLLIVALLMLAAPLLAAQHDRLTPKPMEERVAARSQNIRSGMHTLPLITWGADIATVAADMQGYFKSAGVEVKLVREDVFSEQVRNCLAGETPRQTLRAGDSGWIALQYGQGYAHPLRTG